MTTDRPSPLDAHRQPGLAPGIVHVLRYRVPPQRTVPALYPEAEAFRSMPPVFATGFLVGLLEWCCMAAIEPYLRPGELSLGTHIDVSHGAPTPVGLLVTARSRLVGVDGRRLQFEVEAHDGVDIISRGRHERCVVERGRFDDRLGRKRLAGSADYLPIVTHSQTK